MRLLLIEDDDTLAALLAEALSDEGYRVTAAATSAAARDHLAARWDLILSDSLAPAAAPLDAEERASFAELARHAPLEAVLP